MEEQKIPSSLDRWARKAAAATAALCLITLAPIAAYRLMNPRREYVPAGFSVGGAAPARETPGQAPRSAAPEPAPEPILPAAARSVQEPAASGDSGPAAAVVGSSAAPLPQTGSPGLSAGLAAAVRSFLPGASPAASPPAARLGPRADARGLQQGAASAFGSGAMASFGGAAASAASSLGFSGGGSAEGGSGAPSAAPVSGGSPVSDPGARGGAASGVAAGKGVSLGAGVADGGPGAPSAGVSPQELAQTLSKNIQKSLDMLTIAATQAAASQAGAGKSAPSAPKGPGGTPNPQTDSKSIELNGGKVSATALVGDGKPISDTNGIIGFSHGGSKVWEQQDGVTFTGSDVPFGGTARVYCGGDPNNPLSYGRPAELNGGTGVAPGGAGLMANGAPAGCSAAGF